MDAPFDGFATVHDGRVVAAIEELGDGVVRSAGVLLHEVHRHLAGKGEDSLA